MNGFVGLTPFIAARGAESGLRDWGGSEWTARRMKHSAIMAQGLSRRSK